MSLTQVIVVDHQELKWWYCTECDVKENGIKKHHCKTLRVRVIVNHLRSKVHHNKLSGDLLVIDTERRKQEAETKRKKEKVLKERMALNKVQNEVIMDRAHSSNALDDFESNAVFELIEANPWHQQIKMGLKQCHLNDNLTIDQLRALNYLHTVHEYVVSVSSIEQIKKCLIREQQHSAMIPNHYTSPRDISDCIRALADAQRDIDRELIRKHREVSICEDGNKLRGMGARGYMVKVLENYCMKEIFCDLKNTMKSPELSWEQMKTIDTGKDCFNSMMKFVTDDLRKQCDDIASIATDWSGTNGGKNIGASARV